MKIAVLGATGGTGKSLVEQALEKGHKVVASSRNPQELEIENENLEKIPSNIFDTESIKKVIDGSDAVVFSVGVSSMLKARKPGGVYEEGGKNTIKAMKEVGIDRGIFVSSSGIKDKEGDPWWYLKIIKPILMKEMYEEMDSMETDIRSSDLNYTIVRAPWLSNGDLTKDFEIRVGDKFEDDDRLSRKDLAYFLLNESEENKYEREIVSLTY